MKNTTLIVLIVLVVAILFYWQSFMPASSPADQIDMSAQGDSSAPSDTLPEQQPLY